MEIKPTNLWGLRSWTAARWREYGFRLVLELIVVFVGVYLASAFARYQDEQKNDARRHQIRQALIREIEGIVVNTRNASVQVRRALGSYQESARQKEFMPPQPMIEPIGFQTHMWQATLQSGALDLFEVSTVYQLSEFYNQLSAGFEQLAQLRELSERFLLPVAGAPAAEFYDLESGRPKPKYAWYFDGMRRLASVADQITEQGERLIADMRREDGIDDSRTINIAGVQAEVTLRHLVRPDVFRDRLPKGARALTLRDQDLDSTAAAATAAAPALLDYGVALLSIVKTDSVTVQDRTSAGAYALWWLYAMDTTAAPTRILVPLHEWHTEALAEGPMRTAQRSTETATIALTPAADGNWSVQLRTDDLQIQGSCVAGPFSPAQPSDLPLYSASQRYMQQGGERARCNQEWNVVGTHSLAQALREAFSGPAARFHSTTIGRGWRARVSGDPDR